MKKLLKLLFLSPLIVVVLPLLLCISWWGGNVFYGNWIEYRRIYDLTERYGDELFQAVQGYEDLYTLNGYADRDELSQYIIKERLDSSQKAWGEISKGDSVWVATSLESPQVVRYTDGRAELIVEVHRKEVRYWPNGPEIISSSDRARMTSYTLFREDGNWKVGMLDVCGVDDRKCIRYMKHIEEKWYHID